MKKHAYKLLVVDIDGTLVGKDGTIAAEDKEAVARVAGSGIRVALSTGRVTQACLKIINQLSLDGYHIFFDGALVGNPDNSHEVYVEPLSRDMARQIIDYVHHDEINLDLYSSSHYYIERETWASNIRRQFFGLQPIIVDFNRLWPQERIIKGTLVVFSAAEKAKAESCRLFFKDRLSFSRTNTPAYPGVDFINVTAPGVSKGKALAALASFLGIPLTGVMAIGDGVNDVSLLAQAGLAIAMGNASDELKVLAHHITADVDHHGVAAAVERFLL